MTLEEMRETQKFANIEALYNWGLNYDSKQNPFNFFLDLIGYSKVWGEKAAPNAELGYVELDYIADALKEYVLRPNDSDDFITQLMEAEQN